MIYLFDGSFEGLLTCVFTAFENKESPSDILDNRKSEQLSFADEHIYVPTEFGKSTRVFEGIKSKSRSILFKLFSAFMADSVQGKDLLVFNYICLLFKFGTKIEGMTQDSNVIGVDKLEYKVNWQTGKLAGFLRFEELEGNILYAKVNPTDNILAKLAAHFADRFTNQNFIIFDEIRNLYAVYNTREWMITDLSPSELPARSEGEEAYQLMWREFLDAVTIKERENLKLQRQLMPKKYWRNMAEMNRVKNPLLETEEKSSERLLDK